VPPVQTYSWEDKKGDIHLRSRLVIAQEVDGSRPIPPTDEDRIREAEDCRRENKSISCGLREPGPGRPSRGTAGQPWPAHLTT